MRQGDPLSPTLFNLVMDKTLKGLSNTTGVKLADETVNHLAHADDVVLLAETKTGLQDLLESPQAGLDRCGLRINVTKSATLDVDTEPRDRQMVVNAKTRFRCG